MKIVTNIFISGLYMGDGEGLFPGKPHKVHYCSVCDYASPYSTSVKRHMLIHTGEKPFCCDICRKSFKRKYLLEKHYFTAHNKNILPFSASNE